MELLDDVGPTLTHFVHCGDLLEAAAASVHAGEHDHTLADEFEHANNFLRSIRKALPKSCRLIWLNGNHDDNIFKRDPRRIPKALRDMIEIGRDSRWPEFSKWTQYPYAKNQRGQVQIGQVVFFHGFDAGQTSDELEALQFNNITGGHSHRLFCAWAYPLANSANPMLTNPQSAFALLVRQRGYLGRSRRNGRAAWTRQHGARRALLQRQRQTGQTGYVQKIGKRNLYASRRYRTWQPIQA